MRRMFMSAAFALAALMPYPALAANTWGTDFSDLWWNPYEDGWGANISHQGETIFLTMFVYGFDNKPKWYVASSLRYVPGSNPIAFTGDLQETTGPAPATIFLDENVRRSTVGSATILFPTGNEARLSWDIKGLYSTKWIERLTFRDNNLSGNYTGATIGTTSGCAAGNGSFSRPTQFAVVHTGPVIAIRASSNGIEGCTYSGNYTQRGRMGTFEGTVACANGMSGKFDAYEAEAGFQGMAARYDVDFGAGCTETGRMGGLKGN